MFDEWTDWGEYIQSDSSLCDESTRIEDPGYSNNSEPLPDLYKNATGEVEIPPPPMTSGSDSYIDVEPNYVPAVDEIINFADTLQLKSFIKSNRLDDSWYIVMSIKDVGAVRADIRPDKSKVHPCHLFKFK